MKQGTLYIIATPIGNLEDISLRAIRILREADLIAAEDTRHSRTLLDHYSIDTPSVSYHQHNEAASAERLLKRLDHGQSIALICDAGTPAISDPGGRIVTAALRRQFPVVPVPGASALSCALSVSGFGNHPLTFQGFLPARSSERLRLLKSLSKVQITHVFFEAPHRISQSMKDLAQVFGEQTPAFIGKEMTKVHETVRAGSLGSLIDWLEASSHRKRGEFVVIVSLAKETSDETEGKVDDTLRILLEECSPRAAAGLAAKLLRMPKSRLYKRALQLHKGQS